MAAARKEAKKQPFLEAFSRIGTIVGAARAVGISRYAVIDWRKNDPQFKSDFQKAEEDFTSQIESVIHEKALSGDLGACIFLLRARAPERYTERFKHTWEEGQFERLVTIFSGVIKRCIPQDLWPTVGSALNAAVATLQAGKGSELLS